MSRSLVRSALRAVEKIGPFKAGKELSDFFRDNNIGTERRGAFTIDRKDRKAIRAILLSEFQVPLHATEDTWDGLSRHEALEFGANEKMTTESVREEIVALKAFSGKPLNLFGADIHLPDGVAMVTGWSKIVPHARHSAIVLIENWEAFERIHRLSFPVPDHLQEAIVVYRGDLPGYSIGAVHDWLKSQDLPVYVFSDQDPAGLVIALTTPGFAGLMFPPFEDVVRKIEQARGARERYLEQCVNSTPFLLKAQDPEVIRFRDLFELAGKGIPQEEFVR